MMTPFVDVIVPVHGPSPWVGDAIESVLAQTYPHWHLTLVDDGSPEGPPPLARAYAERLPERITLLALAVNRGPAGARMAGVRQVCGPRADSDLIAFLDSDDRWLPDYLATQVRVLEEQGVEVVHGAASLIDGAGRALPGRSSPADRLRAAFAWQRASAAETQRFLALQAVPMVPTTVLRRAALAAVGGLAESFVGGEDWSFWMRLAARFRIAYTAQPLVERRLHGTDNGRWRVHERLPGWVAATQQIADEFPALAALCRRRCRRAARRAVRVELALGHTAEAVADSALLLRLAPLDPRAWGLWLAARGVPRWGRAMAGLYRAGRHLLWPDADEPWLADTLDH